MSLKLKIWLILGGVMIGLTAVSAWLNHRAIEKRASLEMRRQAVDLRATLMATRRVYQKQFLASGLPLDERTLGFLPAHAMSRIAADYPNWTKSGVRFNNVSDRPRNPANQADADELAAMAWFRAHPAAEEYSATIRDARGGEIFHFAAPIWTEVYCLACHATPESAPPAIQRRYQEGYGYQPGDLRGVMSIRIPAEVGRVAALAHWRDELTRQALLLLALLIVLGLLLNRYVTRRILSLHAASNRVAQGDYAVRLVDARADEIGDLARGFNAMAGAIESREQALRDSETRFQALFEHMQSGFALHRIEVDANGRPLDYVFLMVNPAFRAITGLSGDSLIGKRVTEVLPGIREDDTDWIGIYGRVAKTGEAISIEAHSRALDKWFSVVAYRPQPGLFAALFNDITEARRMRQNLAESEEKYRILADYSSEWEYWLGADGRYRYVSPACAAITGHRAEEFLADAGLMERLLHADDLPAWREHLHAPAAMAGPPHVNLSLRVRARDGDYRSIEHVCAPIFDAAGVYLGRRGVNHDITERKRAEELERFSAFQAGIAEMSTSVLHNIGNAITAVTQDAEIIEHTGAELLRVASLLEASAARGQRELADAAVAAAALAQRQCAIQGEAARAIRRLSEEEMRQRTRRLSDSVRHIADIVRIQQSAALPNSQRSTFSLSQAIHAALEMQGDVFARHDIEVAVEVDPAVGLVTLAHNRLLQSLVNLVKNAVEAIRERSRGEGFRGRLTIRAEPLGDDSLRLSVEDNGIGVAPESRDMLFRFGYSTKERGTGFGLHSVAVFAQESGGRVALESAGPDQGARFVLELPLIAHKPAPATRADEESAA